jgi:hypothetical protein
MQQWSLAALSGAGNPSSGRGRPSGSACCPRPRDSDKPCRADGGSGEGRRPTTPRVRKATQRQRPRRSRMEAHRAAISVSSSCRRSSGPLPASTLRSTTCTQREYSASISHHRGWSASSMVVTGRRRTCPTCGLLQHQGRHQARTVGRLRRHRHGHGYDPAVTTSRPKTRAGIGVVLRAALTVHRR